jgi:hypothetical protein
MMLLLALRDALLFHDEQNGIACAIDSALAVRVLLVAAPKLNAMMWWRYTPSILTASTVQSLHTVFLTWFMTLYPEGSCDLDRKSARASCRPPRKRAEAFYALLAVEF